MKKTKIIYLNQNSTLTEDIKAQMHNFFQPEDIIILTCNNELFNNLQELYEFVKLHWDCVREDAVVISDSQTCYMGLGFAQYLNVPFFMINPIGFNPMNNSPYFSQNSFGFGVNGHDTDAWCKFYTNGIRGYNVGDLWDVMNEIKYYVEK